jgi:amino acid transporter
MTLIEVGGLVLIIVAGLGHGTDVVTRLPEIWPSAGDTTAWIGIAGTALTAVFAFIGLRIKARCMTI